jgi:carbamoyltransferase
MTPDDPSATPPTESPGPFRPTHRMLFQHHALLGHIFVPGLNVRIPRPSSGGYFVRTNAQGFRSNWDFQPRRGVRSRILFFGDSVTAGDGCENHERFSDLVGAALDVDTFNYGLPGTGTDQQLLALREMASDVEADVVVLGLYVENIERNQSSIRLAVDRETGTSFRMPKPHFQLDASGLRLCNVPVPRHWASETTPAKGRHTRPNSWLATLRRVSRHPPRGLDHLVSWTKRLLNFRALRDYGSENSPGWRLLESILREFQRNARGMPVLLVPIPTYSYLVDGLHPGYQARFERLVDGLPGSHLLDLTSRLRRLPRADRRALLQADLTHFNAAGHRCVASIVADAIRDLGLTRPAAAKTSVARPPTRPAAAASTWVLGLSCFFHDASAAIVKDGEIVAASLEERFTRRKHDGSFPRHAINYCLEEAGIDSSSLAAIVYHQDLGLVMERMLMMLAAERADASDLWQRALEGWVSEKMRLADLIRGSLDFGGPVFQNSHHRSHAASAFFASPYQRAAVLTLDGVGEWATGSMGVGAANRLEILRELDFPHSIGLLYSALTRHLGFRANTDEYKVMGLAPYGSPLYVSAIRDRLLSIDDDGAVELSFDARAALAAPQERMAALLGAVLGVAARQPNAPLMREHADLARSLQDVLELVFLRIARFTRRLTGERTLCLAGGVALNCAAAGRLLREGVFEDVWIQPAADDSGAALGAALDVYYTHFGGRRRAELPFQQRDSCLGPQFSRPELLAFLDTHGHSFETLGQDQIAARAAALLADGKIVGRFAHRGEFGPRALGSRSILADPRRPDMQAEVNRRVKLREAFRPFAPAVLEGDASLYFQLESPSPYMSFAIPIASALRRPVPPMDDLDLRSTPPPPASNLPAITHVDHTARVQTVDAVRSPDFHAVLCAFRELTGCAVVLNTSFNVHDEPIVWTPHDAYRCFMRSGLDALVLGPYLLLKEHQRPWRDVPSGQESAPHGPSRRQARRLQRIYRERYLPACRTLRDIGQWPSWPQKGWRSALQSQYPRPLPEIGTANGKGADALVDAITRDWRSEALRAALRPTLTALLALARESPERTGAPMPEDTYVMF